MEQRKTVKKAPSVLPKKKKFLDALMVISKVIFLLAWVFSVNIAAQLVLGFILVLLIGAESLSQPLWSGIYAAGSYALAMAIIIIVPYKISSLRNDKPNKSKSNPKTSLRSLLGLSGAPTWTDIGLAPAGFIVYMLLAGVIVGIFALFPWFDAEQAQDVGFSLYISGFDKAIAFLTLVVVAPIAEEIIFRGWLYAKIRNTLIAKMPNYASMIISMLLVSALFGILHGQWNVGVNVFAMSLVLCALREITGTIYAGILLHILKNGIAFYLLYVLSPMI